MLDPTELLTLAQNLSRHPSASPGVLSTAVPTEAELRRAVSTAYYALFHAVLRSAADRFVGMAQSATAAYSLVYRGFDHFYMNKVCGNLQSPNLDKPTKKSLKRALVSQETRDFATAFVELQANRHLADYDPTESFAHIDVLSLVDTADVGIQAFIAIPADEQLDILAFLLVKSR